MQKRILYLGAKKENAETHFVLWYQEQDKVHNYILWKGRSCNFWTISPFELPPRAV